MDATGASGADVDVADAADFAKGNHVVIMEIPVNSILKYRRKALITHLWSLSCKSMQFYFVSMLYFVG